MLFKYKCCRAVQIFEGIFHFHEDLSEMLLKKQCGLVALKSKVVLFLDNIQYR